MDLLRQDLRYAVRRLLGSPVFTVVAILSLALGIGANTAIFSIVNAVLLRELPVAEPGRLVEIYTSDSDGLQHATSSYPDYLDVRAAGDVFEDVLAYELFIAQIEREDGTSAIAMGELVTGNYFEMLGLRPAIGRTFRPEEDATPNADPVVVLGHDYWQRAYGGDPGVIGRTLRVNRRPFTIIGVASAGFNGMFPALRADLFAPMMMIGQIMPGPIDRLDARGSRSLFLKGRLAPGITSERANAAVATIANRLAQTYPESNEDRTMAVIPTRDVAIHPMVDRALLPVAALLLAVVGLVLLIACANLASFLLARAADRRKEIAVRLALGANRGQLVRQLLIESLLLALAGGSAGLLVARWTLDLLEGFQPPLPIPIQLDIGLDPTVLAFTLGVSVLAGLAFGLIPGLQATRPDLAPVLRDEAGNLSGGRRRVQLRNVLVVTQVAVSLMLLIGSGLFVRSLQKAQRIDPGFDTGPAAILWPNLELSGITEPDRIAALYDRLVERMHALPGVTDVALADRLPLGAAIQTRGVLIDGVTPPAGADLLSIDFTNVDAGYFGTLDIPILAGRNFQASDGRDAPAVALISETAARAWWPSGDPVGRSFYLDPERTNAVTVIGVVRDTKVRTLGEAARPYLYFHAPQSGSGALQIVVRGTTRDAQLVAAARTAALEIEPNLVILEAKTMRDHLALMLFPPRMAALLLSVLGGLALVLAAIGLYGLVSYAVARRTREVGIRLALGASSADVVRLMTGSGLRLIAIGSAIGLALAAAVTGLLARFLYGIEATDLITFLGVPALLGSVGLLASWVPARRASRVDPQTALRAE